MTPELITLWKLLVRVYIKIHLANTASKNQSRPVIRTLSALACVFILLLETETKIQNQGTNE